MYSTHIPTLFHDGMLSSRNATLPKERLLEAARVLSLSAGIATIAVTYAEIMFRVTTVLYRRGIVKRYGPLPHDRNMGSNWLNAFGFILPSAAYAQWMIAAKWHWQIPNVFMLYIYTFAYMILHDFIFYACHRLFHASKFLYNALHAKHHDYTKATNVFVVGFAEVTENLVQVGGPWLLWTALAGRSGDILLVTIPMSVTIFTTLLGHGGMRMHPVFFIFHPWAAVTLFPIAKHVLTPGDHQMHHVYRRCNMGLFFRMWDKLGGTYRKCCIPAKSIDWWTEELAKNPPTNDKIKTEYEEVEVSFGF